VVVPGNKLCGGASPCFGQNRARRQHQPLGLPSGNFVRHNANTKNLYTNPAEHSREFSFAGNQYNVLISAPTTYFDDSVDSSLRWPFINGVQDNNRVTVYPGTTTYLDFERAGGFLTGTINLSGAYENEDLSAITLNFSGLGKIYDAATNTWSYLGNYNGLATLKRDAIAANVKRPSVRDYRLFLTDGDWEMSSVTLTRQLSAPNRTSSVSFIDYNTRYDGKTYFGAPIHIEQGESQKDFDYCLGTTVVRFWDRKACC
jgi:hypothetical protein